MDADRNGDDLVSVKHRFQSAIIDAGDPDLVGPDEWNDTHELDPRNIAAIFEECFFAGTAAIYAGGVAQGASGTSAATSDGAGEVTGPSLGAEGTGVHHPGVIQASTGTTATGRCGLMTNQGLGTGKIVLYGGGVRFGWQRSR